MQNRRQSIIWMNNLSYLPTYASHLMSVIWVQHQFEELYVQYRFPGVTGEVKFPDSKLRWPHVGPTWILPAPRWDNVGPTCLAVWVVRGITLSQRLLMFTKWIHLTPSCYHIHNIFCKPRTWIWLICDAVVMLSVFWRAIFGFTSLTL